jgi:hypothetical protein
MQRPSELGWLGAGIFRARLTSSEYLRPTCACSVTLPVIHCRSAQSISANDDEGQLGATLHNIFQSCEDFKDGTFRYYLGDH